MSSLSVVSNFVTSLHSDPLWYRSVTLHLVCKFTLNDKRLVRRHDCSSAVVTEMWSEMSKIS